MSTAQRRKHFIAGPAYSHEPDYIIHSFPYGKPLFDEQGYKSGKFEDVKQQVESVQFFVPLNADREQYIKVDIPFTHLKKIMAEIKSIESITIEPADYEAYAAD